MAYFLTIGVVPGVHVGSRCGTLTDLPAGGHGREDRPTSGGLRAEPHGSALSGVLGFHRTGETTKEAFWSTQRSQ